MHIAYSLFLFISPFVFVYCIYFCMYVSFSFDTTILVNKDGGVRGAPLLS